MNEKTNEQLKQDIENIPLFTSKAIATKVNEWVEDIGHKGITESNKDRLLALVSNGYQVIQFKEVYNPIMEVFNKSTGFIKYHEGKGMLICYPNEDKFQVGSHKIGILLLNSVDKSSAVRINFVVSVNDYTVAIPNVNGIKSLHIGKVKILIENYEKFIVQVQDSWKSILDKLCKKELSDDEKGELLKELKFTKKVAKEIVADGKNSNLWDFFLDCVQHISKKKYRNEINQMQKLEKLSKICYDYALLEEL